MHLSIDCRFIGKSGIGTYIENIVDSLLRVHTEHQYLLITDNPQFKPDKDNVSVLYTDISPFSLKELFRFPVNEINKTDAFFSPYINIPLGIKVPIFSTIHDVIFLDLPELVGFVGRNIRKFFLWNSIRLSKSVFTVSQFSKNRIVHYFGNKTPIIVSYSGISEHLKKYKVSEVVLKKDYFIYVGNVKKHKGLKVLVDAFDLAKKKGLSSKLFIVGDNNKFRSSDDSLNTLLSSSNDIEFTGFVSNDKLFELISEAKALVLPSFYEGLGLPPMEALYLGTNAIISDIEVFQEIYKDLPVTFFETGNSEALSEILLNYTPNVVDTSMVHNVVDAIHNFDIITNKVLSQITNSIPHDNH